MGIVQSRTLVSFIPRNERLVSTKGSLIRGDTRRGELGRSDKWDGTSRTTGELVRERRGSVGNERKESIGD